jgi:hypothetical protein
MVLAAALPATAAAALAGLLSAAAALGAFSYAMSLERGR